MYSSDLTSCGQMMTAAGQYYRSSAAAAAQMRSVYNPAGTLSLCLSFLLEIETLDLLKAFKFNLILNHTKLPACTLSISLSLSLSISHTHTYTQAVHFKYTTVGMPGSAGQYSSGLMGRHQDPRSSMFGSSLNLNGRSYLLGVLVFVDKGRLSGLLRLNIS